MTKQTPLLRPLILIIFGCSLTVLSAWAGEPFTSGKEGEVSERSILIAANRPGEGRRVPARPSDREQTDPADDRKTVETGGDASVKNPAIPYRRPGHGIQRSPDILESSVNKPVIEEPDKAKRTLPVNNKTADEGGAVKEVQVEEDKPEATQKVEAAQKKIEDNADTSEEKTKKKRIRFSRPGHEIH